MDLKKYFVQLEILYDQIPPMTCQMCGDCCSPRVRCYAIEYLNIKQYINESFSSDQKNSLEKRIVQNRFVETVYQQKKGIIPRIPCLFKDTKKKTCSIYPARPFLCRMNGMKGDKGSCERVEFLNGRDFDLKHQEKFLDKLLDISKAFIKTHKQLNRKYDYLQNWLYMENFGDGSRFPFEKDLRSCDVNFDEIWSYE